MNKNIQGSVTSNLPTKYTREEVSAHNTKDDLWIIINNKVYNVTGFQDIHPGSAKPLLLYGGRDATDAFTALAKHEKNKSVRQYLKRLQIGIVS